MRMRKKKHGAERLAACESVLIRTKEEISELQLPLHVEIGCGKGAFVTQLAAQNPQVQYVALERVSDVLLLAAERAMAQNLPNVRFLLANAQNLADYFAPGQVDRIYLNFSDPWPKKGYAKRRLTHRGFLEQYRNLLSKDGCIQFKTDNRALFDFSLAEFSECGWRLDEVTYDPHNSAWNAQNIRTEYEEAFSAKGFPIHRLVAYPPQSL